MHYCYLKVRNEAKEKGRFFPGQDQKRFVNVSSERRPNTSFLDVVKGIGGRENERKTLHGLEINGISERYESATIPKTSKESRINENVEIRCGQSKYSIRAWEIDGKVFDQGFKLVTEESDNEGDDDLSDGDDDLADGDDDLVGESESEEEESDHEGDDEVSDGDDDLADGVSSENFDGVEKQSSSVKENFCSVNQEDEGTRIRDSHEFEKTHNVVLEDSIGNSENLDINTPKKVAWEGSIGNLENLHFNIPKNGRSSAGKNQDKPNVDSFTFCGANNILQVNDNYEGGPRQLFEPLSVKLSVLLSRQTPIKDKLLRIQDKNEAYLEHSGILARDNQTNTMERRVTRSQAKFQSLSQNYGGRLDRDSEVSEG
ncbi:hypothetical protein L2E82_25781 [Cichorium intybus]|uniref:Uncharacterized protein n=1 Tax=Cichorium intybus TaxID=13427 RepID=A0ACB9E4G1_CICIN|nr:hypothetical protein L2E82_25781 [Cichorium intybus]